MNDSPSWDDPELAATEPKWRARYRLLQSWYRETILGAPPGRYRGRLRGNHLSAAWLAEHPDANFLSPEVIAYVKQRVPEVLKAGGTLDDTRLHSNLLSSMPLCFNLFGHLRAHPHEAATVLSSAFDLDIAVVDRIEVEWAPDPGRHLRDRTAFDAFVEYRTDDGKRAFVGVETKYTESFSPEEYDTAEYRRVTANPGSGFRPGAADVLKGGATNQLWRNALLVVSLRQRERFEYGHVAVVACENDLGLRKALDAFAQQLDAPSSLLRTVSYERIIDEAARLAALHDWAVAFRTRYLDLSPVEGVV